MNEIEEKAFNYLSNQGIEINKDKITISGSPDFFDINDNGYEIKKLNGSRLIFSLLQMKLFSDNVNVLIFQSNKKEPLLWCNMKDVRLNALFKDKKVFSISIEKIMENIKGKDFRYFYKKEIYEKSFSTPLYVPDEEIWKKVKRKVLDKNFKTISEYIFSLIKKDLKIK